MTLFHAYGTFAIVYRWSCKRQELSKKPFKENSSRTIFGQLDFCPFVHIILIEDFLLYDDRVSEYGIQTTIFRPYGAFKALWLQFLLTFGPAGTKDSKKHFESKNWRVLLGQPLFFKPNTPKIYLLVFINDNSFQKAPMPSKKLSLNRPPELPEPGLYFHLQHTKNSLFKNSRAHF